MRRLQPYLPGFEGVNLKEFGDALLKGYHPREARPLSAKRPLHLVMRSSRARGALSFLHPVRERRIRNLVREQARRHGLKVYRYANSGNHLHLLVLTPSRKAYLSFIRALSGLIARLTLGAERGRPRSEKFWDARPFTRIVEWGRAFRRALRYLLQNEHEAFGVVPYRPRKLRGAPP